MHLLCCIKRMKCLLSCIMCARWPTKNAWDDCVWCIIEIVDRPFLFLQLRIRQCLHFPSSFEGRITRSTNVSGSAVDVVRIIHGSAFRSTQFTGSKGCYHVKFVIRNYVTWNTSCTMLPSQVYSGNNLNGSLNAKDSQGGKSMGNTYGHWLVAHNPISLHIYLVQLFTALCIWPM